MRWVEALKLWNEHKKSVSGSHVWCVPRKGTPEHAEVLRHMKGGKAEGVEMKVGARGSVSVKHKDVMSLPEPERRKVYAAMKEKHAAEKAKVVPPKVVVPESPKAMGGAGAAVPKAAAAPKPKPAAQAEMETAAKAAASKIDEFIIRKRHGKMIDFPIEQHFHLFGGALGREGLIPSTGSVLKAIKVAIREVFGVSGVPKDLPENLHNDIEFMKGDGDIKIFKTGKRIEWMNVAPDEPNTPSTKQTEIGKTLAAAIKKAHDELRVLGH